MFFMFCVFYFGQAGIEWKVLRERPRLHAHFHGTKGMVISGIISAIVTAAVGASGMGVAGATAAALAGFAGLFTNEFTFNLFESIYKLNGRRKVLKAKITAIKARHGKKLHDAAGTIALGGGAVIGFLLFILWAIGVPFRFALTVHRGFKSLQHRKVVVS